MWNLSSNRLSYQEYIRLRANGLNHDAIIQYAKKHEKQCNSNLCTLYKFGIVETNYIKFRNKIITINNIEQINLNKAYISYFREHFGLQPKRNTIITSDFLINDIQLQILIGSVLGDGHIPRQCNCLNMIHGIKQMDYMKWKVKHLGKLIVSQIKQYKYYDSRVNKELINIYVNTIPHKLITHIKHEFYVPNKQPPLAYIRQLNAIGLTVWYCDDGSIIRNNKARICTNSFQRQYLEPAVDVIKNTFDFKKIWINKDNVLLFSSNDSKKLKLIIEPFIPLSMKYKLGD